eukprot:5096149-Pleurochrysis_carterae.AAC.1
MVLRNGFFSFRWTDIFETCNIPKEHTVVKVRRALAQLCVCRVAHHGRTLRAFAADLHRSSSLRRFTSQVARSPRTFNHTHLLVRREQYARTLFSTSHVPSQADNCSPSVPLFRQIAP